MSSIQGYPRFAHVPALVTLGIVIDRGPVSLNRTYGARAIKRRGAEKWSAMLYMTGEADKRRTLLKQAAVLTKARSTWPNDLWAPAHVRISMYVFNSRTDAAADCKLVADALEGVLYRDDSVVSWGEIPKPVGQGAPPRIELVIELLEQRTPFEARSVERASLERKLVRLSKKGSPGELAETKAAMQLCISALHDLVKKGSTS